MMRQQQKTQKAVAQIVGGYPGYPGEDVVSGELRVQTNAELEANIQAQLQNFQGQRQGQGQGQGQPQPSSPASLMSYPTLGPLRVVNRVTEPTFSTASGITISSTGATLRHDEILLLHEGLPPQITHHGLSSPGLAFSSQQQQQVGGTGPGVFKSAAPPGTGGPGPRPSALRKGGLETHFEDHAPQRPGGGGGGAAAAIVSPSLPTLTTNPNKGDNQQGDLQSQIEESLSSSIHEITDQAYNNPRGYEIEEEERHPLPIPPAPGVLQQQPPSQPKPPRQITPSLATLEKAISCRIYFENLYFPLLRHPPSREQRRLAMEEDMKIMGMNDQVKERVREMWRRNETEYLREKRRRVDVSCFEKVQVIGHGEW